MLLVFISIIIILVNHLLFWNFNKLLKVVQCVDIHSLTLTLKSVWDLNYEDWWSYDLFLVGTVDINRGYVYSGSTGLEAFYLDQVYA